MTVCAADGILVELEAAIDLAADSVNASTDVGFFIQNRVSQGELSATLEWVNPCNHVFCLLVLRVGSADERPVPHIRKTELWAWFDDETKQRHAKLLAIEPCSISDLGELCVHIRKLVDVGKSVTRADIYADPAPEFDLESLMDTRRPE